MHSCNDSWEIYDYKLSIHEIKCMNWISFQSKIWRPFNGSQLTKIKKELADKSMQ